MGRARERTRRNLVPFAALAFFFLASILNAPPVRAHAVLVPGDVVLVGIETSDGANPGAITVGMLAELHLDGTVEFTDHGLRADGTFRVTEGRNLVEALRMPIPRGRIFRLDAGTMSFGARDQVSIYEGTIAPDGVLSGGRLTFQATWGGPFESECTSDATSTLDPALGLASIALPMSAEAFVYIGRTSGTRVEILTQIHNPAYWRATTRALFSPPTSLNVTPIRGEACASTSECASGFCVDGVCCESTCGGGLSSDCVTCNFGALPQTGTCGLAGPEHLCRRSSGYCDLPEVCDGSASACPPDGLVPDGFTCRPVRDVCDVAELCDGRSIDCPEDALAGPDRACREATDACDLVEHCSGALSCPPDVRGCIDAGPPQPDAGLDASISPFDASMPLDARMNSDRSDAQGVQEDGWSAHDAATPAPSAAQCGCVVARTHLDVRACLGCMLVGLVWMRKRTRPTA